MRPPRPARTRTEPALDLKTPPLRKDAWAFVLIVVALPLALGLVIARGPERQALLWMPFLYGTFFLTAEGILRAPRIRIRSGRFEWRDVSGWRSCPVAWMQDVRIRRRLRGRRFVLEWRTPRHERRKAVVPDCGQKQLSRLLAVVGGSHEPQRRPGRADRPSIASRPVASRRFDGGQQFLGRQRADLASLGQFGVIRPQDSVHRQGGGQVRGVQVIPGQATVRFTQVRP